MSLSNILLPHLVKYKNEGRTFRRILCTATFLFLFSSIYAQQDTVFWFAAPEISQSGSTNLDRPIVLRLTAASVPATVTISQPAAGGMPPQIISIPANSTVSFDLTTWINVIENAPANTVLNYGLKVSSTTPISAYYHEVSSTCICNPEIFVLKGRNALGTDFWIPGQDTLDNDPSYIPMATNSFDIVATQDFTTVTITPSHNIIGHAAGVPFNINLNMGQTYSATASSNLGPNHLCGSRVISDKPIAITEKDDLLSFTTGAVLGRDNIGDQIVPVNVLGTDYIPVYGGLGAPGDKLFITATQANTDIYKNGVLLTTIGAGQTYRMSAPSPSCYLQTSHPAYVYQLTGIGSEVGSALLPQINCTGSTSVSFTQSSTVEIRLNLLVKNGGQGSFLVNGTSGIVTAAAFSAVPGTGGVWYSAQVPLSVTTYPIGTVLKVENTSHLFHLGVLNGGPVGSGASFGYFSNYGNIDVNAYTTTSACPGDSIRLFATNVDSATYLWGGPSGFSSTLINPVLSSTGAASAGIYTVSISLPGCTGQSYVLVDAHNNPAINLGNDTSICNGASITLFSHALLNPGSTFAWNTGASTASISANTGTYWLAITDSGCTSRDTISIQTITLPIVRLGNDTALCSGNTVTLTSTQPAGSTYLWSTGSTANPITVTVTGNYWLAVTDSGCTGRDTIHVIFSPGALVNLGPDTANCEGNPVVLQSSNTYTTPIYLWNDGSTLPTLTAATTGTYWLQVTDLGCPGIDSIHVIVVYDTLHLLNPDTAICKGKSVQVSATANPAATYQWLPTAGIPFSSFIAPNITPDTSAMYVLTVMMAGCPPKRDSFFIDVQPNPKVALGGNRIVCQFDTLHLTAEVSPGWYNGYTYSWAPATSLDHNNTRTVVYTAGVSQNYILTVSTPAGCIGIDSTYILVQPGNFASVVAEQNICPHDSVQLTISGGAAYSWHPPLYLDDSTSSAPWAHPIATQTYTAVVTSTAGCKDSVNVKVNVWPGAVIFLGDSIVLFPGESYHLIPSTNCVSFLWFPAAGLSNTAISDPVANPGTDTKYLVYGTTEYGCKAVDSISVYIAPETIVGVPNVFTPGTGANNILKIIVKGEASLNYFRIFNRWGNLIFDTKNVNEGWDGAYKGVQQPFGVYVYDIQAVTNSGKIINKHGNVTLLR